MKITLDWETYYDTEYSLTNMTTTEYIYDSRFKVHGVGIAVGNNEPRWYTTPDEINKALAALDWNSVELIGHNLIFDGGILAFKYGYIPKQYLDTAAISRCVMPFLKSHSLKVVSAYLGIGEKISTSLTNVKGVRYPTPEQLESLGVYCIADCNLSRGIYDYLCANMSEKEYRLVDITTRMFTQPKLALNDMRLRALILQKKNLRKKLIKKAKVAITTLRSTPKLVAEFQKRGIEPPKKPSPSDPEKEIFTFQRDLPQVQALTQHQDPEVRALITARLEVMSSIDLNRATRMLAIYESTGAMFPIPLMYYKAHTGRWAGGDKINAQNFTRGPIRKCIIAPPHHVVGAVDASQIEARLTAWLAEHLKLLAKFADPLVDVYVDMAAEIFHKKSTDIDDDERFVGKTLILSAGFGVGWKKLLLYFQTKRPDLQVDEMMADAMIRAYRAKNYPIVMLWKHLQKVLEYMIQMEEGEEIHHKCLTFGPNYVRLPDGNLLMYPKLGFVEEIMEDGSARMQMEYEHRGKPQRIYGGRFTENIVQALARSYIGDSIVETNDNVIPVAGMAHDEIIVVPHVSEAETVVQEIIGIMSTPPSWAPDLPLAAEGAFGESYGDAK